MPFTNSLRSSIALAVVGAVSFTTLAAVGAPSASAAPGPAGDRSARCAHASGPFDIGTATATFRSRGRTITAAVAYPATSNGHAATPVCRKSRLIIAGHGSQGDGAQAAQLHSYLVRSGYVVAAPTFPNASGYDFEGFATDVSRTITRVRKLSKRGGSVLSNRLTGKVGYIGTSMGAIVGMQLVDKGSRDRRINAVVSRSGAHFGRLRGRGGPALLMIHGNRDTTVDYSDGRQSYRQARRPKGFITLRGVGHDLNTGGDSILSDAALGFFGRFLKGKKRGLRVVQRAVNRSDISTYTHKW